VGPRAGLDRCGKISSPPGFDARIVRPVATRYTDYATRSTFQTQRSSKFTNIYPALFLPNVSVCLRFCMRQLMCIFYSPPPPSLTPLRCVTFLQRLIFIQLVRDLFEYNPVFILIFKEMKMEATYHPETLVSSTKLHRSTFQKTVILALTAVGLSDGRQRYHFVHYVFGCVRRSVILRKEQELTVV
jgi:hypothetical protein